MPGTGNAVGKLVSVVATDNGRDMGRAHSPIGKKSYSCGLPTFSNALFAVGGLIEVVLAYLLHAPFYFENNQLN
jgi:hypothetical protein